MSTSINRNLSGERLRVPSPYDKVRDAILDGTIQPGDPLVESSLAQWCGVSRTPVREALTRLEQDGLVQRSERGLIVRRRSPEQIIDVYETRIVLEVTAARAAAQRSTPFDLIRLDQVRDAFEETDPNDGDGLSRQNREFHRGVWVASHNESLTDLLDRLNLHLMRYPATTLSYPGRWHEAIEEHRELASAIRSGDADRAAAVAERHFTRARDIRMALWKDGGRG